MTVQQETRAFFLFFLFGACTDILSKLNAQLQREGREGFFVGDPGTRVLEHLPPPPLSISAVRELLEALRLERRLVHGEKHMRVTGRRPDTCHPTARTAGGPCTALPVQTPAIGLPVLPSGLYSAHRRRLGDGPSETGSGLPKPGVRFLRSKDVR